MAPADLSAWADYLHQSFWNDILLAGRPARLSRHGRADHACCRGGGCIFWPGRGGTGSPCRSARHVLGLRGWCVGRWFYRGVPFWAVGEIMAAWFLAKK